MPGWDAGGRWRLPANARRCDNAPAALVPVQAPCGSANEADSDAVATASSTDKIREKKRRLLVREQRIVDTALHLLLRQGVDQVTVAAIASAAGIGKGTVYKHFECKAEIMLRIVLDYEQRIAIQVRAGIAATEQGDRGAAAKAYFDSRLADPALDRLVQRLELRLESDPAVAAQMEHLHRLRSSSIAALNDMVAKLIARGLLEDVPPHYHYLACWALAQGAVDICFNKSVADQFDDRDDVMRFIARIGVTMGNRGQLRGD